MVAGSKPQSIRNVVLLPAPFGQGLHYRYQRTLGQYVPHAGLIRPRQIEKQLQHRHHQGDVTETTQADLTQVLLDFQATARHQFEQLMADFSRGAVIDALHHADEFLGG